MRTSYMRGPALLLLSGTSLVPAVAYAQTEPPTAQAAPVIADDTTADIVVTAQKRSQTLQDVPLSVTALSGAQLVDRGITNVQDLAKVTPGLSFVESGRGVPVFSLRGVGFFDQSAGSRPTVSVYLDEAPIPFSIEAKGAAFDLERVEVLKGPQGTLFGQNATGGAINYVAAKPTSTPQGGVTASLGRFMTTDVTAFVSGPVTSTLNARLALRTAQSGDWQKSYTRDDTLGRQNFVQGRLLLDWRPVDRLKVAINVNGFHDGSDLQAGQFVGVRRVSTAIPQLVAYRPAPADDRAADWDANTDYRSNNDFIQTVGRLDFEAADNLTLTFLSTYSDEKIRQFSDGDGTAITNYNSRVNAHLTSISEELRATGQIGKLQYIVGANYAGDKTHEFDDVIYPYSTQAGGIAGSPTPLDQIGELLNQRFDTSSAFGDVTYQPIDLIRLHGGVRYTSAILNYNGCTVATNSNGATAFGVLNNRTRAGLGLAPLPAYNIGDCVSLDLAGNSALAVGRLAETNVSWRGGIDIKPAKDILFYGNVSRGYKQGSAPTPAATSTVQFTPVKQESLLAYEVGAKATLFHRLVQLSVAGFYYDYTDKQLLGRNVFTPNVFGALSALVNVPKSRIQGAEFQISLFPMRGLTLTGSGTYLDSKVVGNFLNYDIVGTQRNFNGSAFPYTPKWQLVFDGDYRFRLSDRLNATVGTNVSYRSSTTASFGGDPRLGIDAYTLVDLRAGIESADKSWKVGVYGRNVTNQYYWSNVSAAVDSIRRYAGMPATYGVQVGYKI